MITFVLSYNKSKIHKNLQNMIVGEIAQVVIICEKLVLIVLTNKKIFTLILTQLITVK
jgi:hypothetical protein